jgi:hypothetical protein
MYVLLEEVVIKERWQARDGRDSRLIIVEADRTSKLCVAGGEFYTTSYDIL